jgi:hypothetical protein
MRRRTDDHIVSGCAENVTCEASRAVSPDAEVAAEYEAVEVLVVFGGLGVQEASERRRGSV